MFFESSDITEFLYRVEICDLYVVNLFVFYSQIAAIITVIPCRVSIWQYPN